MLLTQLLGRGSRRLLCMLLSIVLLAPCCLLVEANVEQGMRWIGEIDGLELVGRPDVCVVAFAGRGAAKEALNCYSLCDVLKENFGGWELATLQRPASVHLALTLPSARNAAAFIEDLKAAVATLRADPGKWSGGTAGLYGTASKLPAAFVEESAKIFLDTMYHCVTEQDKDASRPTNAPPESPQKYGPPSA